MTEQDIIQDIVKSGKKIGRTTIVEKYDCSNYMARKIARQLPEHFNQNKINMTQSNIGISEVDLRMKHDNLFIIKAALPKLQKGVFYTNAEFIQLSGVKSNIGINNVTDRVEFQNYKGKANGTQYWGHPEDIKRLKEEGILK